LGRSTGVTHRKFGRMRRFRQRAERGDHPGRLASLSLRCGEAGPPAPAAGTPLPSRARMRPPPACWVPLALNPTDEGRYTGSRAGRTRADAHPIRVQPGLPPYGCGGVGRHGANRGAQWCAGVHSGLEALALWCRAAW
jgi:hypothetical protein